MKGKIIIQPSAAQLKRFAEKVTEEIRKFIEKHEKPEGPKIVAFTKTVLSRMDFVDGTSPHSFYGTAVCLSAQVKYTVKGGQLFEVATYSERIAYVGREPTKDMFTLLVDEDGLSPVEIILFEPEQDDIIVRNA